MKDFIDPNNFHFKNLFEESDLNNRLCPSSQLIFSSNIRKKSHMFLCHYSQQPKQQIGGSITDSSCLNILNRGKIIYFSINYDQYKDHYNNFFSSDMVPEFLDAIYKSFKPKAATKYKFHAFFELVNQQKIDNNQRILDTRSWFTNVYRFFHFNEFVRQRFEEEILKRIIQVIQAVGIF